jgi:hypothetical protein
MKSALNPRRFAPQPGALLESKVVSDTKEPALQIRS